MRNQLHRLNILLIVVLLGSGLTSCNRRATQELHPEYWPTENWKSALPEDQGMDSAELVQMFEYVDTHAIPVHSVLIVRNGYLITEAYWQPYGPSDKHSVESITKSIIETLIGIAIDRGEIKSTETKGVTTVKRGQFAHC